MDLIKAIEDGNLDLLKKLQIDGRNLDLKDEDERTPLHWAAALGRLDIIDFLLSSQVNANVNSKDDGGWTSLMSATSAGYVDIVSRLLNSGADANLTNANGQIPLHFHRGHQEIAELLLDYTTNIDHQDDIGSTPLMRSVRGKPCLPVVLNLIDHGAQLNLKDHQGNTALHLALMDEHGDLALLLVQKGADIYVKNKSNVRCIDLVTGNRVLKRELITAFDERKMR